MTQTVIIPYMPRPLQLEMHKNLKRYNVLMMHRRFGKSVFAINEMIMKALKNNKQDPQYAYIAPEAKQAKDIIWKYLKHYTEKIPNVKINNTESSVTLPNGATIKIYGLSNAENIRGLYFDGMILDEVDDIPVEVWVTVLQPTLMDRQGWVLFIGTPKGELFLNELFKISQREDPELWYGKKLRADETGHIASQELIQGEMLARNFGLLASFRQEYYLEISQGAEGSFYGHIFFAMEDKGLISEVAWDPRHKVYTGWDLGFNNKTVIWFAQNINGTIRIIDYYEASKALVSDHIKAVLDKPYVYAAHFLPHDARAKNAQTGFTTEQLLKNYGLKVNVLKKGPDSRKNGILCVQTMLPNCQIDKEKCAPGIKALKHYRAEFNIHNQAFSLTPLHDWSSDAADAFRYLIQGLEDFPTQQNQYRELNRQQFVRDFDALNY